MTIIVQNDYNWSWEKMVVLVYFKTLLFKVKSNQIPPNYNYNFKKLSKLYNIFSHSILDNF